jgi:ComF family protein
LDYKSTYLCGDCRKNPPAFDGVRAVGYYQDILKDIIHIFKYRGKVGVGKHLIALMNQSYREKWDLISFDAIIPVPLHSRRLKEREFDQALILAKGISKRQNIPLMYGNLVRQRWTESQTNLAKKERAHNVKGAFSLRNPDRVRGLRILLIDDVYTTGATISECAKVLKKTKAQHVYAFTIARA